MLPLTTATPSNHERWDNQANSLATISVPPRMSTAMQSISACGVPISSSLPGVIVIGRVGHPDAKIVRVVHISDTRGNHTDFRHIPMGHILVHSGDFDDYRFHKVFQKKRECERQLARMNHFFHQQPHPYKVFVAGNEDITLETLTPYEIQARLPSAIYLQDASCSLFGLNIYGSPWNVVSARGGDASRTLFARGFATSRHNLERHWASIPSETDVLVTHQAPWASNSLYRQLTQRIKPLVHLFGDDRAGPGIQSKDDILFSNGAMNTLGSASELRHRHQRHYGHKSSRSRFSSQSDSKSHSIINTLFSSFRGASSSSSANLRHNRHYVNMNAAYYDMGGPEFRPNPIIIDIYVVSEHVDYVHLPRYLPNVPKNLVTTDENSFNLRASSPSSSSSPGATFGVEEWFLRHLSLQKRGSSGKMETDLSAQVETLQTVSSDSRPRPQSAEHHPTSSCIHSSPEVSM